MKKTTSNPHQYAEVSTKSCIYCKTEKAITEFPRHIQNKDGYDNRCRFCIKEDRQERSRIRRTAPPPPTRCDSCGAVPNIGPHADPSKRMANLALDHNKVTKKFRGYLCDGCNRALGQLGDSLDGVMNLVRYLQRSSDCGGPDGTL